MDATVPWYQILEEIKSGRSYGDLVLTAREIGKGNNGFDSYKESKIPTYTVNATFNQRRRKDCIISATGLLYLDMDGCTNVDLSNSYIYAAYQSVSGTGMSIIVKVSNLNEYNIKPVYTFLQQELNIALDFNSADLTRQTVFSYDPNLFVNYSSIEIDAFDIIDVNQDYYYIGINLEGGNKPILKKKEKGSAGLLPLPKESDPNNKFLGTEVRWNDLDRFQFEGEYLIFEHPVDIVKAFIPNKIPKSKRHYWISAALKNFLYLNPIIEDHRFEGYAKYANSRCEEPITENRLRKIISKIKKEFNEGSLEPVKRQTRSVVYSPNCSLATRRKINGQVSGRRRVENTHSKIYNGLIDWDYNLDKPTNQSFANYAGVSLRTFKKYLKNYPELIELRSIVMTNY